MSSVYFISDTHLGHRAIMKYRTIEGITTEQEHSEMILDNIKSTVTKRDTLWFGGDVAFTYEWLMRLKEIQCRKHLILGNHDEFKMSLYLDVFERVHAFVKLKSEFWISHAPLHEAELRGKISLHGHVHSQTIMKDGIEDSRYFNLCVENINYKPISMVEILDRTQAQRAINKIERDEQRRLRNEVRAS